jgi:hypothetical protein
MHDDAERGPHARYEMFSRAGNDACEKLVVSLADRANAGTVTRKALAAEVRAAMEAVARKHAEVFDTEPESQIAEEVTRRICGPQMWSGFSRWEL